MNNRKNSSRLVARTAFVAAVGVGIGGLMVPASADPIGPSPTPGDNTAPIVVVATPGTAGQPTLVISPPTDAQPTDPARVNPIGGARIASSVPVGLGPGNGKPLLESQPRLQATVPPFARNGIFVKTGVPGKDLTVHLPDEMLLSPAEWGPNGVATYSTSNDEYSVVPLPDGGVDFSIRKKTSYSPNAYQFFLKLPAGTHWEQQGSTTVIKSNDEGPQKPSVPIGTFSAPAAKNKNGTPLAVTTSVSPLSELILDIDAQQTDNPIEVNFSYHPS
ncbi:hypothetical protein FZI91_20210 [Mycobacterium sp. CBMA271]|uniref:hypothetical protein n=1 Tax=unclassified Mycobacteroides TaxID=2618759 RepID=UPI0012DF5E30|nr:MULTISPECIES: hypothetical protein [unclassified Mycobacteroides]MUM24012.1 hypothetical protein [Mycobacteroides sp. CBMA 271]